ncbi:VENN motif pre-toxin domain-containing protein [Enterobacter asburiae]|jgi:filamentous hemagglutinin|nr:VENN motif pre-toxin domain-containing protein [Enterobacter asburiae]MBW4209538.1 VENN motif pre-toxin domain-containing protein [Enterobacter asburiae]
MYPGKAVSDLSEELKQTVSTLATISAGMAGEYFYPNKATD